ncbi:tape measure protein, partial [Corynebacterium falsenii]|uniref:tape measure protein n=1 Tax=Corynebacterium falsenii TaxID=108486 RepID=UPI001D30A2D9
MDGAGRTIEKELAGVGERAGSAKGKGLGGKLFGGLKVAAAGAGVAVGGVLAGSISKGFKRLRDIESAEAKLSGLGHSAETVEGVMKNALASVKGTAFGLGDAAGLAGTLVASGIKPGKDLEKTLKLTADSATIAGRELGDMGLIWGSVAAKGKLQGDDAMQLLASGVPIWQMVGDVMGKTAGEAQELGSKGEVSFEIFQKAMEKGVGGAAQKAGNTTEGAFKNMGAAMGRFGATLLKDVYPLVGPVLNKVTDLFDYLDGAAGPAMEAISGKLQEFGKGVKSVWDLLVNRQFNGASQLFGLEEDSGFVTFLLGVHDAALELYEKALKPLGKFIADNIIPIFAGLGAGALYAGITAVVGAISGAIAAAGGLAAVIGSAVGAIAWVPIAIGAAIAALVWFFRETEAGQAIFGKLVSFVRDTLVPGVVTAFTAVKNFIVEELWPIIKSRFEAIRDLAVQVWQGVIQPAFEQFAGFLQGTVFPIIQRLWQEYVQPAFMAIGGLAVWLWENAFKPAMSGIDTFIRNVLGPVIVWLWQNVVSPIFGLIGKFIGWVWNTLIFPYLDMMKYYFTVALPTAFKFLWDVAKQVWSGISAAISAVVDWITGTAVPFIQAAWD